MDMQLEVPKKWIANSLFFAVKNSPAMKKKEADDLSKTIISVEVNKWEYEIVDALQKRGGNNK